MKDRYDEIRAKVVETIDALLDRRKHSIKESIGASAKSTCTISIGVQLAYVEPAPFACVTLSLPIKDEMDCELEDERQTTIQFPADPQDEDPKQEPEPEDKPRIRTADEEIADTPAPAKKSAPKAKAKKGKKG